MGQPDTKITDLCTPLGITRQTLCRHVSPTGELRPAGSNFSPTTASRDNREPR